MALPLLDASNPLTFYWLAITTFFETGLGVAVALFYLKVIPYFHKRASLYAVIGTREIPYTNNPLSLFLPLPFPPFNKYPSRKFTLRSVFGGEDTRIYQRTYTETLRRPVHLFSWAFYVQFLRTGSFCVLFTATGLVLTSTGWRNPFLPVTWNGINAPGWYFDLVFARVNDQPNGAHIISELMVMLVGWTASIKYRDQYGPDCMIGLLAGGFLLADHEGFWESAYYLVYAQYLSPALITNVLKDLSFTSMVILFAYSFWRYPLQKIPVKAFIPINQVWIMFLGVWVVVPWIMGFGAMPISTINNFSYGHGIFSETIWWGNPWVEGFLETGSWVLLGSGITLAIAKIKTH